MPRTRNKKASGVVNSVSDIVGNRGGRTEADIRTRFVSRVMIIGSGCHVWTGSLNERGYGILSLGDRNRAAHRVSWVLNIGDIPVGLSVCHKCDNPACVRPDHLFLGTRLDNNRDSKNKGRNAFGSKNGMAKLTGEQVRQIRALRKRGASLKSISELFGVQPPCISRICNRVRWEKS